VILTGGLGMAIAGRALVALDQLERLGAKEPRVTILAPKPDAAIQAALSEIPMVRVLVPPFDGVAEEFAGRR
jgi:hypothetical protein